MTNRGPRLRVAVEQMSGGDWRARAACRLGSGHDPRLWDEPDPSRPYEVSRAMERAETAIRICMTACPVRAECLAEGIDSGAAGTIWGGRILPLGPVEDRCVHCHGVLTGRQVRYCSDRCRRRVDAAKSAARKRAKKERHAAEAVAS